MRSVIGCFLSAACGALLTVWLLDVPSAERPAFAQERSFFSRRTKTPPPAPATPVLPPSQPRVSVPLPAPPAEQGAPLPPPAPPVESDTPAAVPRVAVREGAVPPPYPTLPPGTFNADGLTPDEAVSVAVYERCNKSVVNITTKSHSNTLLILDVIAEGSGSGAVIDRQGHILTNYHVVEGGGEVQATLYDGKSYDAKIVGADPINDIAVIRIDAPEEMLVPVEFGDSSRLRVGMKVFAIGNPFGLERTMTTGIISSVNRSLQIRGNRTIKSIIQIDAAVNPGNSGGPLLDSHGRLIGLNTAIASSTGQSAGVGFAIPVNLAARVVPQLLKHGRVIRPEAGITRVYETDEGLLIARLAPGGPAERAGLRGPQVIRERRGPFVLERTDQSAADLIVAVDGEEVKTGDDFLSLIERHKVGEVAEITVMRGSQRLVVPVTLGTSE